MKCRGNTQEGQQKNSTFSPGSAVSHGHYVVVVVEMNCENDNQSKRMERNNSRQHLRRSWTTSGG